MIGTEIPVLAVLCGDRRPPDMDAVEAAAEIRYTDEKGLPDALRGADALFVYDFLSTAVPGAWHAADRIRWVHIASAGVDPVMFPELRESDVVLTNSRGVFDDSIAEYVLGVVIAFAKDLPRSLELQRQRRWQHRESERVAGRRALVVGTGPIGRAIARLLRAAGLDVSGMGRRARGEDPDFGTVHASADLVRVAAGFDYVIAVAPLTDETKGMFDAAAFAAMKPSARFVNVGRGELVVTDELVTALRAGEIAGAALDVFDTEPLPVDHPLWTLDNVVISPHMSGDFVGWRNTLVEVFADNFARWRDGRPLRNVVDKQLGYVPSGH
ncbi:Phosphoglycerate dehydrogenase [Amycolatopsis sacchari]|uniref:Phosphoglycerate dehydrogenase n=1 Tax=Amycolatopsis sacchari TaxID=115433 RepID=A0A1I3MUJ9_9PSEU|nr:D-2-hydroxyacid dehydrogenase [Amycolatopsis sacchari]SFJ00784.1 Phosphoglycerate dehydrogenase [Amycolatopsis sacchari]